MTISASRRRDHPRARRLTVTLDGQPRPRAFYADGRRGVVREFVFEADAAGVERPVLESGPDGGPRVKRRELRGRVGWRWAPADGR